MRLDDWGNELVLNHLAYSVSHREDLNKTETSASYVKDVKEILESIVGDLSTVLARGYSFNNRDIYGISKALGYEGQRNMKNSIKGVRRVRKSLARVIQSIDHLSGDPTGFYNDKSSVNRLLNTCINLRNFYGEKAGLYNTIRI